MSRGRKIAVIGLGYVGLAITVAFARSGSPVVGFDIDAVRIQELQAERDRTHEVASSDLHLVSLHLSNDVADLRASDFFIVTVPTPIDGARRPNLSSLLGASRLVGTVLKKGDIVIYESTVYAGAVEEECVSLLEMVSGSRANPDFDVGYSPERVNPGDRMHRFETITLHQDSGGSQGDRKYAARPQYRFHE